MSLSSFQDGGLVRRRRDEQRCESGRDPINNNRESQQQGGWQNNGGGAGSAQVWRNDLYRPHIVGEVVPSLSSLQQQQRSGFGEPREHARLMQQGGVAGLMQPIGDSREHVRFGEEKNSRRFQPSISLSSPFETNLQTPYGQPSPFPIVRTDNHHDQRPPSAGIYQSGLQGEPVSWPSLYPTTQSRQFPFAAESNREMPLSARGEEYHGISKGNYQHSFVQGYGNADARSIIPAAAHETSRGGSQSSSILEPKPAAAAAGAVSQPNLIEPNRKRKHSDEQLSHWQQQQGEWLTDDKPKIQSSKPSSSSLASLSSVQNLFASVFSGLKKNTSSSDNDIASSSVGATTNVMNENNTLINAAVSAGIGAAMSYMNATPMNSNDLGNTARPFVTAAAKMILQQPNGPYDQRRGRNFESFSQPVLKAWGAATVAPQMFDDRRTWPKNDGLHNKDRLVENPSDISHLSLSRGLQHLTTLKAYFDVSQSYVAKKSLILLFPYIYVIRYMCFSGSSHAPSPYNLNGDLSPSVSQLPGFVKMPSKKDKKMHLWPGSSKHTSDAGVSNEGGEMNSSPFPTGDHQPALSTADLISNLRNRVHIETRCDLYIPVVSFTTYVLLYGCARGKFHDFHPRLLSRTGSFALVLGAIEVAVSEAVCFVLGSHYVSVLDMISVVFYKFYHIAIAMAIGLIISGNQKAVSTAYWSVALTVLGFAACVNVIFLLLTEPQRREDNINNFEGRSSSLAFVKPKRVSPRMITIVCCLGALQLPLCWLICWKAPMTAAGGSGGTIGPSGFLSSASSPPPGSTKAGPVIRFIYALAKAIMTLKDDVS